MFSRHIAEDSYPAKPIKVKANSSDVIIQALLLKMGYSKVNFGCASICSNSKDRDLA